MNELIIYTADDIRRRTRVRQGEQKVGELVRTLDSGNKKLSELLETCSSDFVLLGIPEDIGVRANFGRGGAWSAWETSLSHILNVQSSDEFKGNELLVLGHIHTEDLMDQCSSVDFRTDKGIQLARNMVEELDRRVHAVIAVITAAGKIPVVIGGGHNNAYPLISGTASGLHKSGQIDSASINVINCDAHSDFRIAEGRHSGNGFRYAWSAGFMQQYAMVGLHKNFNPATVVQEMQMNPGKFQYTWFEDIYLKHHISFRDAVMKAIRFTSELPCGIEIDMDTVENIPSSARTPSGISANEARMYVYLCAHLGKSAYLHIAEAAPVLAHRNADFKTGKLISYLVGDFIRGISEKKKQH
ncbi:MAG: formimidoylglutamase [Bacteroidia bacterium]